MQENCENSEFREMADRLDATGQYRVLRRAPAFPPMPIDMSGLKRGIVVDVETTGLDPKRDAIIQLAILPFAFDGQGRVVGAGDAFVGLEDPLVVIPSKIEELTGLTDEMLMGKRIDDIEVCAAVGETDIVIAHHAAFDRKFLETRFPFFEHLAFGCSMVDVPWEAEGFEGSKLAYLMMGAGYFHDAHDAVADCSAVLTLLGRETPKSRQTALSMLMDSALTPSIRLWAVRAPYSARDQLKSRGYRWNAGVDGRPKAWFKDVHANDYEPECAFLESTVYANTSAGPEVTSVDAFSRFSIRS